ncbi:MAG TPA: ABC transporter ATP-binding protein [Galbitalea sp.]|jgi:putative ABC transport system ATP-binding protein
MRPVLALQDVARVFPGPPEVHALRGCTLTVEHGEFVAVVGTSGSGKTTLLNILGLLDRPTFGKFLFDGVDMGGLTETARTSLRGDRIGFVFQSFELLQRRTALENVALSGLYCGRPGRVRRRNAADAIERVGLAHRQSALPATMSGGERQRIAIARALADRPSVLLCDEPTGNLDSANSETILGLLSDLHSQGHTIVLITHDASVAGRADRTLTMRDGRVFLA